MVWLVILVIFGCVFPIYLAWRCGTAIGGPKWLRFVTGITVLAVFYAANLIPFLYAVPSRALLILLIAIANITILLPPLLVLTEPARLVCRIRKKNFHAKSVLAAATILATLAGSIGEYNALKLPEVKEVGLAIPNLPAEFDGYRVVFLSDLHFSKATSERFVPYLVEKVNGSRPDLILFGGDFADNDPYVWTPLLRQLEGLHAADGKFAVAGNHEYFNQYETIVSALAQAEVRMLVNNRAIIRRGERAAIVVAGVTDLSILRSRGMKPELPAPDLQAAIQDIPAGVPVILLEHQPKNARANAEDGRVVLQLSGHTHGGMIAGLAQLVVAPLNGGYVSGLYHVGNMLLYVSNGTNLWNGFSWRIGVPSEITVFTLRRAAAASTEPESGVQL